MNEIAFEKIHKKHYILCFFELGEVLRYLGPDSNPNLLIETYLNEHSDGTNKFYWLQEVQLTGLIRDNISECKSIFDVELETNDHFKKNKIRA